MTDVILSDVSFLDDGLRDAVVAAVEAIDRGLGEKVASVLLVGDAVPPVRLRAGQLVELLAIVSDLPVPALSNLAHQLGAITPKRVQVHVLTERELLRSADVFTLRLADYAARNVVLVGANPLADLHFTRGELRRSIEQSLRLVAWRLRDSVLEGVGQDRARDAGGAQVLRECYAQLLVVAHHLLWLLGEQPPAGEPELLGQLADRAGASASLVETLVVSTGDPMDPGTAISRLADLIALTDKVTAFVDGIGVAD